ncbi:MAG: uracil-DNA glycosylase [Candidatus Aureabacteria bacterium]|nr:uracil-DNA glycosylase [Candidatus Auribacterota bacterium]
MSIMKTKLLNIIRQVEDYLRDERKKGINFLVTLKDSAPVSLNDAQVRSLAGSLLQEMEKKVALCTRCQLFSTRKNTVFGEGSPDASLVFVGEAPGADEDLQGRPFVGRAGQLLTKIIRAIGFERSDVYICNILKCRPPENRTPLPSEIIECREYILSQLDIIKPKVICTLGSVASQALLNTTEGITKLRGRFYDFCGAKLMPTYHPAFLLRNESRKRETWADMKMIKKELGI